MKQHKQASTNLILVTGYLGAGKTTTLKKLLSTIPKNVQAAALINETASKALDGEELQGYGYPVQQLSNGCVCCNKQDELEEQLKEIITKHKPEVLFIETTGLAHPQPLINFLSEQNTPTRAIITVIDAKQHEKTRTLGEVTKQQIRNSSVVIISKTDLVKNTKQLQEEIQTINKQAKIYTNKPTYKQLQKTPQATLHTKPVQKTRHASNSLTIRTRTTTQQLQKLLANKPTITRAKGIIGNKRFHYAAGLYNEETTSNKEEVIVLIGNITTTQAIKILWKLRPRNNTLRYLRTHAAEILRMQQ